MTPSLTPESPAPPDTVRASCALCDWTTTGSPRRVCAEQARHRREAHGFVTEQELRKQARLKQLEPLLRELPGTSAEVAARLGTKPQTLGIYGYVRTCADPPAIVYASPLRHNHEFFSHGIGNTWILKQASVS